MGQVLHQVKVRASTYLMLDYDEKKICVGCGKQTTEINSQEHYRASPDLWWPMNERFALVQKDSLATSAELLEATHYW